MNCSRCGAAIADGASCSYCEPAVGPASSRVESLKQQLKNAERELQRPITDYAAQIVVPPGGFDARRRPGSVLDHIRIGIAFLFTAIIAFGGPIFIAIVLLDRFALPEWLFKSIVVSSLFVIYPVWSIAQRLFARFAIIQSKIERLRSQDIKARYRLERDALMRKAVGSTPVEADRRRLELDLILGKICHDVSLDLQKGRYHLLVRAAALKEKADRAAKKEMRNIARKLAEIEKQT